MAREEICTFLAHRDPFLLLDEILWIDVAAGKVVARRRVDEDDPVFAGHFPDRPLYPAVLQCEAIGQAGLVLASARALAAGGNANDLPVVTYIHGARVAAPVQPGDRMTIRAEIIEDDTLSVTIAGQIHVGDRFCSAAVFEGAWTDG